MDTQSTVKRLQEVAKQYIPSKDVYPSLCSSFDKAMDGGFREGDLVTVSGSSGEGKCLAKGTLILMHDGKTKKVENIKIGDLLMGDDSTPRKVLELGNGKDEMFKIKPIKGESYIANKEHILCLRRCQGQRWRTDNPTKERRPRKNRRGEIKEISIKDYLKSSKSFRNLYKAFRTGVKWKKKKVNIEPYFLGIWLGDGHSNSVSITTADKEIVNYLTEYSNKINLQVTKIELKNNKADTYSITRGNFNGGSQAYSLQQQLTKYNLIHNKHIPFGYKVNSRKTRLKLLAGLIDSDGYINHEGYVFVNKNKRLANDVVFLARSLGFAAYVKPFINKQYLREYWKVGISGDLSIVPVLLKRKKCKKRKQIKNVLNIGFEIKPVGLGEYYGFTLDGNGRFLLGDFTVTHNTSYCRALTVNFSKQSIPTLWFSYEEDPYYLYENFKKIDNNPEKLLAYSPTELVSSELNFIEQQVQEGITKKAIKVIVIDHLHYLINLKSSLNSSLLIGGIVRQLKQMAVKKKVIVILISHTRKINFGDELSLSSIRDSALTVCESDYVFLIERRRKKKTAREKLESDYISSGDRYLNESRVTLAKNRRTGKVLYTDFGVSNGKFLPIAREYDEDTFQSA